jgi:hypothetical protein
MNVYPHDGLVSQRFPASDFSSTCDARYSNSLGKRLSPWDILLSNAADCGAVRWTPCGIGQSALTCVSLVVHDPWRCPSGSGQRLDTLGAA